MVPRISRHDPTVGLYRSILLRKVGSLSHTNQGRGFGLSSITGLGGGRGSSGGNSLNKRGSGSNARFSLGGSLAGARCSHGDGGGGGGSGGGGGGGQNHNGTSRSFSCCNCGLFSSYNNSLRRYNFTDDVTPSQRIEMIRHSWGLPSLSSATAFGVVVYLLKVMNDEEVVRNDQLFVYVKHLKLTLVCLLGLFIMGGIKIVSGEDSPPSVVAGWMVGCVTLCGCYWFGNDVDA